MSPTILVGDHFLVTMFAYSLREPEFKDIIVFKYPQDPSKDFIKRVIGLPGDTIQVVNKVVYRNGEVIDEPYVRHVDKRMLNNERDNYPLTTVPEGKYFVMGDNRDESLDSRFWGFVGEDAILGRAWVIYWSWEGTLDIRWGRIGELVHELHTFGKE